MSFYQKTVKVHYVKIVDGKVQSKRYDTHSEVVDDYGYFERLEEEVSVGKVTTTVEVEEQ